MVKTNWTSIVNIPLKKIYIKYFTVPTSYFVRLIIIVVFFFFFSIVTLNINTTFINFFSTNIPLFIEVHST